MLRVKVKETKEYYNVKVVGKKYDLLQYVAIINTLLDNIKEDFGVDKVELFNLVNDFKNNTRSDSYGR